LVFIDRSTQWLYIPLVVVKNPVDFVGSYIGHLEANTKVILASTVRKVLIIDEVCFGYLVASVCLQFTTIQAYMLFGGRAHGSHTDSFKTAVIDTIVAEVQSVAGDDRCVLLLGYETQMGEMFQVCQFCVNTCCSNFTYICRMSIQVEPSFQYFATDSLSTLKD
jgi:hypothetical protein